MYKVIYDINTNRVDQIIEVTPKLVNVSVDGGNLAIAEVKNVPVASENESLYYIDGKVITQKDSEKVQAITLARIQAQIAEKKALLLKYREDVEQVDLFGMEREDYEEKKAACRKLVEELRVLEKI